MEKEEKKHQSDTSRTRKRRLGLTRNRTKEFKLKEQLGG
jgi:hypothetical protein